MARRLKRSPPAPWTLLEREIPLRPAQEWHSPALNFVRCEKVSISCLSDGKFYAGFFSESDYTEQIRPHRPFWFNPLRKSTSAHISRRIWRTGPYRVVVRAASIFRAPAVHLTVVVVPRDEAVPRPEPLGGTTLGPLKAWDALEAIVLNILLAGLVLTAFFVNLEFATVSGRQIEQGGQLAASLFQGDAEWGILIAAVYVAGKQLPEWLRGRGGAQ